MNIYIIFVMLFIASVRANFNLKNPWEGRPDGAKPPRDFNFMGKWREIKKWEGLYAINCIGEIKSLRFNKILKQRISTNNYSVVTLYKNGHRKLCTVHRLVGLSFIQNTKNKPQINHKNGIKTDNRIENLEWVTARENSIHGFKLGTHKPTWKGKSGKDHPQSKQVYQINLNGNIIREFESLNEASRITGFDCSSMAKVCNGKAKTIGGFIWKYKN